MDADLEGWGNMDGNLHDTLGAELHRLCFCGERLVISRLAILSRHEVDDFDSTRLAAQSVDSTMALLDST